MEVHGLLEVPVQGMMNQLDFPLFRNISSKRRENGRLETTQRRSPNVGGRSLKSRHEHTQCRHGHVQCIIFKGIKIKTAARSSEAI